ncbi:MAG: putative porin [Rikenellaceae bacterium]
MQKSKISRHSIRPFMPLLIAVAMFLALLTHVGVLKAQSAKDILDAQLDGEDTSSLYGANPYATEGEEGEEGEEGSGELPDSLKKERKPKVPLESYFFSDEVRAQPNFKWNVNREFNRVEMQQIDTTLNNWRIDYPYYQKGVGDMTLGGLGQATQPIDYADRSRYHNFSFAQPFDAYTYRMENAPFYNVKKPFTLFSYAESGQKTYRESNFGILHAQNIAPSTGFALDYKARSTKGLYQRQDTKNHNLALTFSHTGKQYSIHAGFLNNDIETEESGGVVGIWTVRDSIFEMPIGIPTKLGDAEASNHYRNSSFFVEQSYGIPLQPLDENDFSMADKTAFYVGHSFEYNTWSKIYRDVRATYTNDLFGVDENGNYISVTDEYYENWFIDPEQTRDSIRERVISNRVFVQAQPWDRNGIVGTLDGGVGLDFNMYNQFGLNNYISGDYGSASRTSLFIYGAVHGKFRKYLDWNGDVKIYSAGYRAGDMSIGADVALSAYIRNKPITLSGGFRTELTTPSYWYENLFSNHFVFTDPLDKESETRIHVKLEIPDLDFELGATQSVVSDMIYYDEDSNIAQEGSATSLTSIYLRKKFQFGGLNLDHRILGQWSTNEVVAPVPDLSAYLSYYYEFWVVENVLRLQIGLDARYTTAYYMPDYNPAVSAFYNQRDLKIGGYPYMDAYVAGKWKRMRIFIKYQHLNDGLFGNGEYFSVANYPLNPGMMKMGFSWGFYD